MARGGGESEETLAQEWRKVKGAIRRSRDTTRDLSRLEAFSHAKEKGQTIIVI